MTREDRNEMRLVAAAAVDLFDRVSVDPQHVVEMVDDVEWAESSAARLRERVEAAANHLGNLSDLKTRRVSTIREAYAHAQEIVLAALSSSAGGDADPFRDPSSP